MPGHCGFLSIALSQRLMSAYYHEGGINRRTGMRKLLYWFPPSSKEAHAKALRQHWGLGRRLHAMIEVGRPCIDGAVTKMLIGSRPTKCMNLTARDVALAVDMVRRFAFVGITEDWDASVCLFRALAGAAEMPAYLKSNHMGSAHKAAITLASTIQKEPLQVRPPVGESNASAAVRSNRAISMFDAINERIASIAERNPSCEGLSEQGEQEKICSIRRIYPNGLIEYRLADLVPHYVDCADEVVYRAAIRRRWDLAVGVGVQRDLDGFKWENALPATCRHLEFLLDASGNPTADRK